MKRISSAGRLESETEGGKDGKVGKVGKVGSWLTRFVGLDAPIGLVTVPGTLELQ
jgi:hypothetical protein